MAPLLALLVLLLLLDGGLGQVALVASFVEGALADG